MFELDQPPEDTRTDINAAVKQVFDATPVAMILSSPDGSFEYVNPAMKRMLGYGNEIYDADVVISHPDDLAINRQIRDRLRRS
uniref:PAS domain-containing protein n=1 Tax=Pontibacterium sp. TaxID=2036026 RepID=UPI0035679B59